MIEGTRVTVISKWSSFRNYQGLVVDDPGIDVSKKVLKLRNVFVDLDEVGVVVFSQHELEEA